MRDRSLPEWLLHGTHAYAVWRAHGVTRADLHRPPWARLAHGRYAWAPAGDLRSRLLRLGGLGPPGSALGGWAAAHLHGATDLDGAFPGAAPAPVLLCVPRAATWRATSAGLRIWRSDLAPGDVTTIEGLSVTSAVRTGFDLARLPPPPGPVSPSPSSSTSFSTSSTSFPTSSNLSVPREAVVQVDALLRTATVHLDEITGYARRHPRRAGHARALRVLAAAEPRSRSCQESRLRLIWTLDAGLPRPAANQAVRDRSGRVVAELDLLDVEAALGIEYDGSDHASAERRAADHVRADRLRRLGLVVVQLTAPDLLRFRDRTVARLRTAHAEGLRRDHRRDAWSLASPSG